jgi:hypothetical protein
MLYAQDRWSLLLVFQAMDSAKAFSTMHDTTKQDYLAQAERHIAKAEDRIARQKRIIDKLVQAGQETDCAVSILRRPVGPTSQAGATRTRSGGLACMTQPLAGANGSHAECANEFASAAVKPSNTDYRALESGSGERKEGIAIDLTFARHCTGRTI